MDPREIASRIRELQQRSQFFGGRGPVLVGNVEPENIEEPSLPGFVPPSPSPSPSPLDTARSLQERRANDATDTAATAQRTARFNKSEYNRRKQDYQSASDVGVDRGIATKQAAQREGNRQANDAFQKDMEENYLPSGILPGEERVTTQDTLRALTPEEQASLRGRYDTSGHSGAMDYEDWLAQNFADMPPEERSAQMRRSATATERQVVAKDKDLLPGENSAVAQSRQAAGKPLPEGRDASQYTPEQRRRMSRNVHSPEVPMTAFGGTFTQNVDGSQSSRAANPALLDKAAKIGADQGEGSPSHVIALAQAYGIDAMQYGDDIDMLRADVMREKTRHDRMARSYNAVDNNMGGTRYAPDPQKAAEFRAEREQAMSPERKMEFARDILKRYAGMEAMTPQRQNEILEYANTPDGFAKLREMNVLLGAQRDAGIEQSVRGNWANRNMTIAANNPRVAQGMYMRSLQQAARTGDPLQMAAAHESFGNERAARDYRSLASQQGSDAATVAAAEAGARAEDKKVPEQGLLADTFSKEVNAALQNPDPRQRKLAVMAILQKSNFLPPEEIAKEADALIASASGGALSPQHTRTWFDYIFGPRQAPQAPAEGPQQAAAGAPPASGRGASLDATMDWLRGNRPQLPSAPHPYRRGS